MSHPKKLLTPVQSVLLVSEDGTRRIPVEKIDADEVGRKAYGLACLPERWTIPFLVVSGGLLDFYRSGPVAGRTAELDGWYSRIVIAARELGIDSARMVIVRSSGCREGLQERGRYHSVPGVLDRIYEALDSCLEKLALDAELSGERIPLIIQLYISPHSEKGHLSNERRLYKETRDWVGSFDGQRGGERPFKINLRRWRKRIPLEQCVDSALECNLTANVSEILKFPAAWAYEQGLRLHYEWVWDGKAIYLVQADEENRSEGIDPRSDLRSRSGTPSVFQPQCLKVISVEHAGRFQKIKNVFTYLTLELPVTNLYVLDNEETIRRLGESESVKELEDDLSNLVSGSLVIRMDVDTQDLAKRQLLPRTHEVRDAGEAIRWVAERCSGIGEMGFEGVKVVFIFHQFIPAVASAFALAAPGERKVQIEALWGLPEGLYYNAHDKYVVDTRTADATGLKKESVERFEVEPKATYKHFFIMPDADGKWSTRVLRPPYDWKLSIEKDEWVREIAYQSRRIAELEGKPVSIMWFIGVPPNVSASPVMPWYHEPCDPRLASRSSADRTKTPFDRSLVIRTRKDIEHLKEEADRGQSSVRRVRIQPEEHQLIRDKNTLAEIGRLTKKIGAVILLEGGVLSHAYYQLVQTDAIVEVVHPFESREDKREFHKLVRDKIPYKIWRGGEATKVARLRGEHLLRALREKLIEESAEVLDAQERDQIIEELADVNEVIQGILEVLGSDRDEIKRIQEIKREKSGGFKEGVVLIETRNPLPTSKIAGGDQPPMFGQDKVDATREELTMDGKAILEAGHAMEKWSDRREHAATTELVLRIAVPIVLDSWTTSTPDLIVDSNSDMVIKARLAGVRKGARMQIELAIYAPQRQPKLF